MINERIQSDKKIMKLLSLSFIVMISCKHSSFVNITFNFEVAQPSLTRSKLITETLEQSVKSIQS